MSSGEGAEAATEPPPASPIPPAVLWYALAVALFLILSLPNFLFPYFEDTALFAAIGSFMNDGLVPYRDLLDQKAPGVYVISWVIVSLLGKSAVAARVVETAVLLAMGVGCGRLASRSEPARAVPVAIVVTGLLASCRYWGLPERGQVELYQGALLVWGTHLVASHLEQSSARRLFVAGCLIAFACWMKPMVAPLGVLLAGLVLARALWRRAWRRAFVDLGWVASGAAAVSIPFLVWLWLTGALGAFYEVMFVDNLAYASRAGQPWWSGLKWLPRPLLQGTLLVAVLLGVAGAWSQIRSDRSRVWWLLALVALWGAATYQYLSGAYFFPYHRLILIPAAATTIVVGLLQAGGFLHELLQRRGRPRLAVVVPVAAGFALLLVAVADQRYGALQQVALGVVVGSHSLEEAHTALGREGHYYDFRVQFETARFVRERSSPDDRIQIIGRGGVVWLHAERLPPTSYLVTSPAFRRGSEHRDRFARALYDAPPRFILVRSRDQLPWFGLDSSINMLRRDPELWGFVQRRYRPVAQVGGDFIIFGRR